MNALPALSTSESKADRRWSLRLLVLALGGIFLLTLYPFVFASRGPIPGVRSPFFLITGLLDKPLISLGVFLNILLFMPFGFGLAGLLPAGRKSLLFRAAVALALGAMLSYTVEFLQFFIPERDSGWEDIFTNSTGSLLGSLVFELCGPGILRLLSRCEAAIRSSATTKVTAVALLLYFAACFAVSARLQKDTALEDWFPDARLVVGNSGAGKNYLAWSGNVLDLDFWDKALSKEAVEAMRSTPVSPPPNIIAAYDFSKGPPFGDRRNFLPDLESFPAASVAADPPAKIWNGTAWAATSTPVSALIAYLEKTNQFTVRIRCEPNQVNVVSAVVVSISRSDGAADLEFRQENTSAWFYFRTPISAAHPLGWRISNAFQLGRTSDLVFSYDGSNLAAFVNDVRWKATFRLSPATRLAALVHHVKAPELDGYRYCFYGLIFFPAGCFVGLASRGKQLFAVAGLITFGIVIPSLLLEAVLVRVGGQVTSVQDIALGIGMGLAGAAWINLACASSQITRRAAEAFGA